METALGGCARLSNWAALQRTEEERFDKYQAVQLSAWWLCSAIELDGVTENW
jgi:hypothetical protein